MVEDFVGKANAGAGLAVVNGVAVIASIFVQPTVGMISDYTITRWGRRKPYIFIGGLLDMLFLYGIATSNTFVALVAFYFLIQVSSNFAQGPFQGYVPDLVPAKQVGMASGLMGLMIVLGSIVGVGIAMTGLQAGGSVFVATMALGAVEIVAMLIVVTRVHEGTTGPKRTMSWPRVAMSAWGADILREKTVLWLLLVRLLFLGAAAAATSLGLYYFQRTQGLSEGRGEHSSSSMATVIVAGMSGLASIPGARLSDRYGRKAGHLRWHGPHGGRPARAGPRSHPRSGGRAVRSGRHRHRCLPVRRLGADERRHPQAHLGEVHGHPQRGDGDGDPRIPDRRWADDGYRRSHGRGGCRAGGRHVRGHRVPGSGGARLAAG